MLLYRGIVHDSDENINSTRHNLSVATIFSTFSFVLSPLFDGRKRRRHEYEKFGSRRRNPDRRRRNFLANLCALTWPDIHRLIDQGHGQASANFLNSLFLAPLIKSLIKAASINQNSVFSGRVLRCSRKQIKRRRGVVLLLPDQPAN